MNPEQRAIAKLQGSKLWELKNESQQLSDAAIHGQLSHGQRVHRRRVTNVLRQREAAASSDAFAHEQQMARPEMQMPNQARYDEAYDKGDLDYRMNNGYRSERFNTPLQVSGYQDGYYGQTRRRVS